MTSIFDEFDKSFDVAGLANDVEELAKNGDSDFPEVPVGTYVVELLEAEVKKSKSGLPMVSAQFKIVEGEFKNSRLFYNQVIHKAFGIRQNNKLFNAMDLGRELKFKSYSDYNEQIMDMVEDAQDLVFVLKYGKNNDFPTFEITEVFDK